jgi:hypothetical protein
MSKMTTVMFLCRYHNRVIPSPSWLLTGFITQQAGWMLLVERDSYQPIECYLFTPWYSWKVAHLGLSNKHSIATKQRFVFVVSFSFFVAVFFFCFFFLLFFPQYNAQLKTRIELRLPFICYQKTVSRIFLSCKAEVITLKALWSPSWLG